MSEACCWWEMSTKLCSSQYPFSRMRENTNHTLSRMQRWGSFWTSLWQQKMNWDAQCWSSYMQDCSFWELSFLQLGGRIVAWRIAPAEEFHRKQQLPRSKGYAAHKTGATHLTEPQRLFARDRKKISMGHLYTSWNGSPLRQMRRKIVTLAWSSRDTWKDCVCKRTRESLEAFSEISELLLCLTLTSRLTCRERATSTFVTRAAVLVRLEELSLQSDAISVISPSTLAREENDLLKRWTQLCGFIAWLFHAKYPDRSMLLIDEETSLPCNT